MEDCRIRYKLDLSDKDWDELNEKNLRRMQEALDAVGIWLNIEDDYLNLYVLDSYNKIKSRGAGRRAKMAKNGDEIYRYSDVVLLMQHTKDKELAEKLGMPIATFYRHKKKLMESRYCKSLDQEQLTDKEYLESIPGHYNIF